MKPIAIIQHTEVGAPGSVPSILDELGLPWTAVRIVDGAPMPERADAFAGLITLGGYMGAYDPLPWIAQEIALLRDAAAQGIPVAGHCLGSQLVAVALGGSVRRNARAEIGWGRLDLAPTEQALEWFGRTDASRVLAFQWHGDTFELPPGAQRLASSPYCENQVFVKDDRHLAMQCHLEMTPELIAFSVARNGAQMEREALAGNPAVTDREQTLADLAERTAAMRATLLRLYTRWARGLAG